MKSIRDSVICVARHLGELNRHMVFVGGSAVLLLVPESIAESVRVTEDVDCVVQAATTVDYYRVADRLRELGFKECQDEGAPICRWVIEGIHVDVMPTGEAALGFRNRWYDWVFVEPLEVTVAPDLRVKVANVPTFFATKFDAFADRGHGDYTEPDFEDIVTVLAHSREDVVALVLASPVPIRAYLCDRFRELLLLPHLHDVVSGCFSMEHQPLVTDVLNKFRRIAAG